MASEERWAVAGECGKAAKKAKKYWRYWESNPVVRLALDV